MRTRSRAERIRTLNERLNEAPNQLLQVGDVILSFPRAPDLKTRLNCMGQGLFRRTWRPSPYSHAAIVTDPYHLIDAVPDAVLAMRPMTDWLAHIDPARSLVLRLPPDIGLRERRLLRRRMIRYYGREYNPKFVPLIPVKVRERSFYCSEYVAAVYRRCLPKAVRDGIFLPMDLVSALQAAGFQEIKLKTLIAEAETGRPARTVLRENDEGDLIDRLGPLAGGAVTSVFEASLAMKRAAAMGFLAVEHSASSARIYGTLGIAGQGLLSMTTVLDHFRARAAQGPDVADLRFEAVERYDIATPRWNRLRQTAVALALDEGTRLGTLMERLLQIKDNTGLLDLAAPDPKQIDQLQMDLLEFWQSSKNAAAIFIIPEFDLILNEIRESLAKGRLDDPELGALYDILDASLLPLTILRLIFERWAALVYAAKAEREPLLVTEEEQVRYVALLKWILSEDSVAIDLAQEDLATAVQRLAMLQAGTT